MKINKLRKILKTVSLSLASVGFLLFSQFSSAASLTKRYIDYRTNRKAITPKVLKEAVNGYLYAVKHHDADNGAVLTIVNFTVPSYQRRMWVIDVKTGKLLLAMHVAQGKNSGKVYATHFSNRPGSDESSPGIFTTAYEYDGEHGNSMRIKGLEDGINNDTMARAVVIHPAWYVTPAFIEKYGYAGRSWGCFAFNPKRSPKFLKDIKGHTVLFAYAPSENADSNVNHALSAQGKKIYQRIEDGLKGKHSTHFL